MGPHNTIGSNSCICRWAHMTPSATAAAYFNGPMRYHWRQQVHMPMGHAKALATAAAYFDRPMRNHRWKQVHMPMGPHDTIGNSSSIFRWACAETISGNSCICQWAHVTPSATAAAYFDGPMQYHRRQRVHMPMGPRKTINNSSCLFHWAHAKPLVEAGTYANGPA